MSSPQTHDSSPSGRAVSSDDALAALRRLLERYVAVSDAEWQRFVGLLRTRRLRRGAHLVRAGDVVDTLAFVTAGVLRRYRVLDDREVTTGFLIEHSFATELPSLCSGEPAESSLQALTETHVLTVNRGGLRWLGRGDPVWRDFPLAAGIALAKRREHGQVELLARSPTERYAELLRQAPTLADRVPHYHIASYLGITPESLSRLRRRLEHSDQGRRESSSAGRTSRE